MRNKILFYDKYETSNEYDKANLVNGYNKLIKLSRVKSFSK